MIGVDIAGAIAARDVPLEPETATYQTRLAAEGGTAQASVINAINQFVRVGKVAGWFSKIKDCCFFVGPNLTSALVKLVQAPGTGASCVNRGSGTFPVYGAWSGTPFQESDYDPSAGIHKTNETPLREIGTEFNPVAQGLSVDNISAGFILEHFNESPAGAPEFNPSPGLLASIVSPDAQFWFVFAPYSGFGGAFGTGGPVSSQFAEADAAAVSNISDGVNTRVIAAQDGQVFQDCTVNDVFSVAQHNGMNGEFVLFQNPNSTPKDLTLGGYFLASALLPDELSSITTEMKLLHHRAHGIAKQELWCGIGDSITFGLPDAFQWKTGWFGMSARIRGARINNSGISGCLTLGDPIGNPFTGLPIVHRYENLKFVGADIITIMCGTNDMDPTRLDGTINGDPTIIAAYQSGLTTMLSTIKSWGATAVMLSPPWNGRDTDAKQVAYNNAAMGAAAAAGVRKVNVYQSMVDTGNPRQFFIGDGHPFTEAGDPVHPNSLGMRFISSMLFDALSDGARVPFHGWGRMSVQARLGREAVVQPLDGTGGMSVDATVV